MTLAAGTYTVNAASGLNLRADASVSAPVLSGMPYGTRVTVTGVSRNGFAQTSAPAAGWAAEQYLSPLAVAAQQNVAQGSYRVTGDGVAIRQAPAISVPPFGAGSNVVMLTALGAIVQATGKNENGFAQVDDGAGHAGWMASQYLAPADPATAVLHADVNVGVPLAGAAPLTPTPATPPAIVPPPAPAPAPGPLETAPEEAPGVLGTTSPIIGLVLLAIALYFVAK